MFWRIFIDNHVSVNERQHSAAECHRIHRLYGMVYGEMEGDNAVTACLCLQSLFVIATLIIGNSIPDV